MITEHELLRARVLSRIEFPSNVIMGGNHRTTLFQHYQTDPEILEFISVIKGVPAERRQTALEIGLYWGGTHLIWKTCFEKVVSIEVDLERVLAVWGALPDKQSSFIVVGDSTNPDTIAQTNRIVGNSVDLLFIDACHSFVACQSDWQQFEPMVRSGGIVAFHDSQNTMEGYGVKEFVDSIRSKFQIIEIYHGNGQGIAYYFKP